MKLVLLILNFGFVTCSFGADGSAQCASELPWTQSATLSNGLATITHFTKPKDVGPNIWPRDDSCLLVSQGDESWWIPSQLSSLFEIGEFVDDTHALIVFKNVAATTTYLLNLEQRDLHRLGGGTGSFIKDGENQGLVLLRGEKRYRGLRGGPFWLDVLVDLNGEVVEFLPNKQGECLAVSEILRADESRNKLRMDVNDCISIAF